MGSSPRKTLKRLRNRIAKWPNGEKDCTVTTLLDALSFLESDLDVIARAVVAVGLKVTKPRKRRKANPCVLNHYPPVQPVWKHDIKVVSVDDETGTTNVRACVGHLQNPYEDEVVA